MSQTTEPLEVDYEALRHSALQDDMEPLTRCALFQENPVYKDLLNNFLSSDLPCAPNLPMPYINHAGICLPPSDVFTEENYTWHGIFRADSTKSEWPTGLIYPPGTRIDTALIADGDDRSGFLTPWREPRLEVVGEGQESPCRRLRLVAGDFDVTAIPLDVLPVEALNLGRPDSAESTDGNERQDPGVGGEQDSLHFIGRENLDLFLRLLE